MNDEFGTGRQAPGSLVFRRQADTAGRRGAGHGMQGWLASPRQRGVLGAAVAGFMLLGVEQARGASESEGAEHVCAETSPTSGKPMDAGSCRTNLTVRKYAPELAGDHPILDSGRSLAGDHPILDSGPSSKGDHSILDSGRSSKGAHPILDSGRGLKGAHRILDSGGSTRVVPPEETIHPESPEKIGTFGKSAFLQGSNSKRVDARLDDGSAARLADERDARASPATLPTSSPRTSREFDSLSNGLETLGANMSWLRSSLSTALAPVSKDIGSLSSSLSTASGVIASLSTSTSTRVGTLESGLDEMSSTARFQAQQIDGVSKRIDRGDAQLGELNRQTASLEQASAEAKSTAQAQAKRIDGVSKRIDRGDARLGELNRQTASLEQAYAEAKATAQAQAKRIDDVSERTDKGDARLDELNRQMAPLARASDEARRNDSFIAPTVSGGGSGPMVESSGPGADHTGRSRIDPAGCTLANGFDATATGLCAAAGTIAGRDGARESRRADGATAYGAYARAREHHATALGFRALAARDGAVAIGYQAGALGAQATALGDGARADGDRSVALGASALATGRGAVALGAGSIADRDATVSIGSPGRERRLVNLAPGVAPGDAVNLSQLATLGRSLGDVARRAYTGVAMSMAMSGLYLPSLNPGEVAAGVGVGGFSGYRAIALNLKGLAGNGRLGWGAGVSTTGRLTGFNLGAGWKW
ncbi:YadA-like family protein [Burkholderia gladioli pv. gladioli]|uniref:YadA family autotransporter adhesin n=1 Tax=Burkholderia gladioli TaxID=28095 RepID=UPI0024BBF59B|nr:YadA-like family protein [Burkholderia gladioli]MDJ1164030.1 YadA-like family protein [Burkholderia gladioli pv. gladioli]